MNQVTSMSVGTAPDQRPPWGFLATVVWGLAGIGVWFAAQLVTVVAILAWRHGDKGTYADAQSLMNDGFLLSFVTLVAAPVWVAVYVLAARLRGWSVRDYFALSWPTRGQTIFGVACMAALLLTFDGLTVLAGRDVVPPFMVEAYRSARVAGALPFFFLAVVVVAPIAEELTFRGFGFRGLSYSRLGVIGAIVITSAAWSVMHVQYDWIILCQIFLIGLLLGWLRWASGSTLLTILLHLLTNLAATLQAVVKVEWMS